MTQRLLSGLLMLSAAVCAQHRTNVDATNRYERLLAIVPMQGTGTWADPKRPMFAPLPSQITATRTGIVHFHHVVSDDGNWALVEIIAVSPQAFQPILATPAAQVSALGIRFFERGKTTAAQVQAEFQKLRKDFRFETFVAGVQ
jgi:hypothetical protein